MELYFFNLKNVYIESLKLVNQIQVLGIKI